MFDYNNLTAQNKLNIEILEYHTKKKEAETVLKQAKKVQSIYEELAQKPWIHFKKNMLRLTWLGCCLGITYGFLIMHEQYCTEPNTNIVQKMLCSGGY